MSSRFAGGLPSGGGRGNRKMPATMPLPPILMLEKLPHENLELSQKIHRDAAIVEQGYTKVMLRGVPRFLIDAFDRILKEKTTEGLFRKEGNAARMKNSQDVYYYKESVKAPGNQWTVHDVCSLVKRFLRDLKTPLITAEIRTRLFEYAKKYPEGNIEPHKLTILFEPSFSDKGIVHPMPSEHIGTLGFIMRKLNELSEDSSVHQMNMHNLATVFAPTIFRDAGGTPLDAPPKTPKVAHGKTSLVLQKSKEENELHIAAMIVLIKNAQWIGVPSNFYLASRQESSSSSASSTAWNTNATAAGSASFSGAPSCSSSAQAWSRSNSLRPGHSVHSSSATLALLPVSNYSKADKGGSVSGRKIEKRHSVKMVIASRGRQEDKEDRRRSNSTVRDFFGKISKGVRRKSGERKSPSRHSSPPGSVKSGSSSVKGGGSSRGRSPAKKIMLAVDDHTTSALAAPLGHYEELRAAVSVGAGRPSLKSSSFLQSLPSKSPKLQGRSVHQQPSAITASVSTKEMKQRPTRPPPPTSKTSTTKIERVGSNGEKKKSSPKENGESRRRVSAAAAALSTMQPFPRRSITSVRDEPNSILGEEFLNPNHKFPVNRVRRHTAPIKNGLALRRNQPNTVHSGLKGPMLRRATTMAAADDKENTRALIRVKALRRDEEEMEEDELFEEEDDTLTDTNQTMTSGIAVVYPSENILELNHMESRARRANNFKNRRRSGGDGGGRSGTTSSNVPLSPINDASVPQTRRSKSPPPLPLCSPPVISDDKVNSGRRSSKRAVGDSEEKNEREIRSGEQMMILEDVNMVGPPLSAPPIPYPRSSLGGEASPHFAIPSLPIGRPSSVSSSSGLTTPAASRRPIGPTPKAAKTPMAANSPLGRRGSSVSALDSPQFKAPSSFASRRQMSVGEKDFAFSELNRAAILDANDGTDLQMHSKVGTRPSVALLRNQNKGMVAARVNLFAAIQSTSDAENASMRSSLGSRQSLTGLDDTLISTTSTVRGGPPVGHSIMSSGGSSSGSSSKRSSIASHR